MKPILFNTEMVQAILDGRKTVTRRVIKPRPAGEIIHSEFEPDVWWMKIKNENSVCWDHRSPPYRPGDVLYVRETWALVPDENSDWRYRYCYKSDNETVLVERWSPSVHMPRDAARIFLRVTEVRVERLRDITVRQIVAEGFDNGYANPAMGVRWEHAQRMAFADAWDATIKPADMDKYGWAANPWVWAVEFERISREEAENG